jgi:hypothetical protein
MIQLPEKYKRLYQKLTNFELLQWDESPEKLISSEDIMGDLELKERPRLFLDRFSEERVYRNLQRTNIFKILNERGFDNIKVVLDTKDPYKHIFRAYFDEVNPEKLLCETYLRKKVYIAKPTFKSKIADKTFNLIVIEWLLLQDPTAAFAPHRQPLPGQKHPGLRIGRKVLKIFINLCRALHADGLLNVPEHYHNAAFYGRYFKYFNPITEGYFQAIRRDLIKMGIYKLTWAFEHNCMFEKKSGRDWNWFTDEQILPISNRMKEYFESREYKKQVSKAGKTVTFEINEEKYSKAMGLS